MYVCMYVWHTAAAQAGCFDLRAFLIREAPNLGLTETQLVVKEIPHRQFQMLPSCAHGGPTK